MPGKVDRSITEDFDEEYDVVVICGYGAVGEGVANFLDTVISRGTYFEKPIKYTAFDLDPTLVIKGYNEGMEILYGDGSQYLVLETAGIKKPKIFVVTYSEKELNFKAVERIREKFPDVPIIARYVSYLLI